ncbi:hypothetical protein HY032_00220 [Candidatus Gottesmanbacteria bacterium]|nr:hypothetical protein [Candidatus Gottesmanbacteria bacterium]
MAGEVPDFESRLHFLVDELGFPEDVAEVSLSDPNYLTVEKVRLFESIPGLTALIRHAREVEHLWLPEIVRTSGTLRVAMGKSPVSIGGGNIGRMAPDGGGYQRRTRTLAKRT